LKIARSLGIEIPTLCHHEALSPYQACRVCLVEVTQHGTSKIVAACGHIAEDGLEVETNSKKVVVARKMSVELLMAKAPAAESIKELAKKMGIESSRFKTTNPEEKCILCGLCTRICNEKMGVGAIGFANRGWRREKVTPFNEFSEICMTCGACAFVCPTRAINLKEWSKYPVVPILSEFDANLSQRPCIYVPFPQAVPNRPVIDRENCIYFKNGNCKICKTICQPEAITYEQEDKIIEEEVGAVVVATGYELYEAKKLKEYGYGNIPDVITSLQFERLLSASGPTSGEIKRPSDGKVPKRVVFIQCAGSRDKESHLEYCSKICCMYTAKHSLLYKHRVHDGEPIIFYIDVRTSGKGYEEFYNRVTDEGTVYIRGKVSKVYQDNGKIIVLGADTLIGKKIEVEADMVVLALGLIPTLGSQELVRKLRIQCDANGFLSEVHPKLRPLETLVRGIYLAGCAQALKDIPDVVAHASGAASKVLDLLLQKELYHEPTVASVNEDLCSGCQVCISICPYDARKIEEKEGKRIASVNGVLCEGCGACVVGCPSGASQLKNFRDEQIKNMIEGILD